MKTLLLIDANSMVHRAYHALPPMTAAGGEPANALYGLSSILLKLWREERPEYAAACFDRPEPTFRDLEFAEYKGKRPPTADDLIPQIIAARKLFPKFGIRTFEKAGFEADDLIGTLACKFADAKDIRVEILTGDRDTLQLVRGEKVVVRTPSKGVSETFTYNDKAIREKYGLEPNQMIDYKALVGDTSDNIKGVPGIGPSTAIKILQKYGTIEKALLAADDKLTAKLRAGEKEAAMSKWLVTLKCDIPVPIESIDDLMVSADDETILDYFRELGFGSLEKRLLSAEIEKKPKKKAPPPNKQGSIF
jgi:DNA polymerase-1